MDPFVWALIEEGDWLVPVREDARSEREKKRCDQEKRRKENVQWK